MKKEEEIRMTTTPHRTLPGGIEIPLVGFGTFLIREEDTAAPVADAISAGYRHVDTAEVYQNERGVGAGLRRGLEATGVDRNDVVVTTKLWPEASGGGYKDTAQTVEALEISLEKLGLDHVDLYLIHTPFTAEQRLTQWRGLVEAREAGLTRAIGVSNFSQAHIAELVEAGLPAPQADQIELHPWSQKPDLVRYLDDHDIMPIAYSSLAPLSTWRTAPGHPSGKTEQMQADSDDEASPFKSMAARYGVSEARLLLRWGVQNGYPVLPKSTKADRIAENADLFSFSISDDDMHALRALDRGPGIAWGSVDPITAS